MPFAFDVDAEGEAFSNCTNCLRNSNFPPKPFKGVIYHSINIQFYCIIFEYRAPRRWDGGGKSSPSSSAWIGISKGCRFLCFTLCREPPASSSSSSKGKTTCSIFARACSCESQARDDNMLMGACSAQTQSHRHIE